MQLPLEYSYVAWTTAFSSICFAPFWWSSKFRLSSRDRRVPTALPEAFHSYITNVVPLDRLSRESSWRQANQIPRAPQPASLNPGGAAAQTWGPLRCLSTSPPTLSPDLHRNEFFAAFFICLVWTAGRDHRRGSERSLDWRLYLPGLPHLYHNIRVEHPQHRRSCTNLATSRSILWYLNTENSADFLHSSTEASDLTLAANHSATSRSTPLNPTARCF